MKSRLNIQQRRARRVRHTFGVLVVMWLNFVLQPCAMAYSGGYDKDCPDCPLAHSEQPGAHDAAPMEMAGNDMPCAGSDADCVIVDDANYDGRHADIKVKDAPSFSPVGAFSYADLAVEIDPARPADLRPVPRHPPGPSRALNELHCIYLI